MGARTGGARAGAIAPIESESPSASGVGVAQVRAQARAPESGRVPRQGRPRRRRPQLAPPRKRRPTVRVPDGGGLEGLCKLAFEFRNLIRLGRWSRGVGGLLLRVFCPGRGLRFGNGDLRLPVPEIPPPSPEAALPRVPRALRGGSRRLLPGGRPLAGNLTAGKLAAQRVLGSRLEGGGVLLEIPAGGWYRCEGLQTCQSLRKPSRLRARTRVRPELAHPVRYQIAALMYLREEKTRGCTRGGYTRGVSTICGGFPSGGIPTW